MNGTPCASRRTESTILRIKTRKPSNATTANEMPTTGRSGLDIFHVLPSWQGSEFLGEISVEVIQSRVSVTVSITQVYFTTGDGVPGVFLEMRALTLRCIF